MKAVYVLVPRLSISRDDEAPDEDNATSLLGLTEMITAISGAKGWH
jgi:hypothetical protein